MTGLLVKLFIKDKDNVQSPKVRAAYGMLSGVVGIVCNVLLFLLKFFAGLMTGAVSVSADAFNNLSDAGSSIVTFIGFKMAGKPADTDHPFGHGRIEYIAGLIVAMAIVVMASELFQQSLDRILHPETTKFQMLTVFILIGSILMKMWMALFNRRLGRKLESAAMRATAADSLSDCISTAVVLASLFISEATGYNIDGYAGIVVAVFVLLAGIEAAKDTLQPLLGQPPQKAFVDKIEALVTENNLVIGVHDLIVHNYGPGRVFVSLHAEVPYQVDMLEAHDVIDLAENRVREELNCEISIHMDPVVTDDEEINELKDMTRRVIDGISGQLKIHDFRVTKGPYLMNLIFDVVTPYDFYMTDNELKQEISRRIREQNPICRTVIHVDKDFVCRS